MKLIRVFTILVLVVVLASSAFGFDGLRKGFVFGGGLGFTPGARWAIDNARGEEEDVDETLSGVAANLLLGYAWNEHNMIVFEGNVAVTKSDWFFDEQVAQGFDGFAWYHYFGPQGKSFFSTVGLGLYYFKLENYDANDYGAAFMIGGGYEFTRHIQVGAYFAAGRTEMQLFITKHEMSHKQVNIIVSAIAF